MLGRSRSRVGPVGGSGTRLGEVILGKAVMLRETRAQNQALAALEKERAAFVRLKDQLLRTHRGKFVAILNGEVVGVDEDDRTLTRRVYAEYGYVPVYIDRVVEKPPVRRILSPKKVVGGSGSMTRSVR